MSTAEGEPCRVVIVDDHVAFADAVSLAINMTPDLRCVATTADPTAVVSIIQATSAELLLCDQHLPGDATGLQVLANLRSEGYRIPAILLTGFPTPVAAAEAQRLNATLITKDLPLRDLVTAMRSIRDGVDPVEQTASIDTAGLSPGELRVLELLGRGRRANDIAEDLSLSVHTVRDHIKAILRKLDCSSQLEAVLEAQRRGLVAPAS